MYNNLVFSLERLTYGELKKMLKDQEVDLIPMNSKEVEKIIRVNGFKVKEKVNAFTDVMLIFQKPIHIESLKSLFKSIGIDIEVDILHNKLVQA